MQKTFVGAGRDNRQDVARLLLAVARDQGVPTREVVVVQGGFEVPETVAQGYEEAFAIEVEGEPISDPDDEYGEDWTPAEDLAVAEVEEVEVEDGVEVPDSPEPDADGVTTLEAQDETSAVAVDEEDETADEAEKEEV